MKNVLRPRLSGTISAISLLSALMASTAFADVSVKEEAHPAGITLQNTDNGVVFADKNGKTIYTATFDVKRGELTCTNEVHTQGDDGKGDIFMLPNQDHRPTCLSQHPLVSAEGGKPVGLWTIVDRPDKMKQWAYDGKPLYTSIKDIRPGDTNAGSADAQQGGMFKPVMAPVILPAEVRLGDIGGAHVLTTSGSRLTLYVSDADTDGKSHCENACQAKWNPVMAPEMVKEQGGWTAVKRADGGRQWAFKGKPLYTYARDVFPGDYKGNGQPGWNVALAVPLSKKPDAITVVQTVDGPRYADSKGITLYTWRCAEPGMQGERAQTECDNPQDRSLWWTSTCGNVDKCADTWRPLLADANAKTTGATWSVVTLQQPWAPVPAAAGEPGQKAWAYKGRLVFTYKYEDHPGMSEGENIGLLQTQKWLSINAEGSDINQSNKQTEVRAASR